MYRAAAILCATAACGLLAWAGYSAARSPGGVVGSPPDAAAEALGGADAPGVVVENADQNLGERSVGQHAVVFRVVNHSDRQGEIVGGSSGCTPICCFETRARSRVSIPPGERVDLVSKLTVHQPGLFEYDGWLYLDDRGALRTVRLRIIGVGVAPEGKPHAPPP